MFNLRNFWRLMIAIWTNAWRVPTVYYQVSGEPGITGCICQLDSLFTPCNFIFRMLNICSWSWPQNDFNSKIFLIHSILITYCSSSLSVWPPDRTPDVYQIEKYSLSGVIGTSLSEPHTSVTALFDTGVYVCVWPYTENLNWANGFQICTRSKTNSCIWYMFGELTSRQWKCNCEPWHTSAGWSQTVDLAQYFFCEVYSSVCVA